MLLKTETYKNHTIFFDQKTLSSGKTFIMATAKRNPSDFKSVTSSIGSTKEIAFERIKRKLDHESYLFELPY